MPDGSQLTHLLNEVRREEVYQLGMEPVIGFREIVRIMMDADLEAVGFPAPGRSPLSGGRFPWLERP